MPNYNLTHHAYCGMSIPHEERTTMEDCRRAAARLIRRRRKQGYPVVTLDRGERWEIQEPEDCMMVPDQCGVLTIAVDPKSVRECRECGQTVDIDDPCCDAEPEPEPEEDEHPDDLCDLCYTSGVNVERTTYCGKTIGQECGCDEDNEEGVCGDESCDDCLPHRDARRWHPRDGQSAAGGTFERGE